MSFMEVFRSLQEVFPQVDIRILKAVAIEHSKDVDAAVEFVLLEVLPSLGESSEPSYRSQEIDQPSANGENNQVVSMGNQGVETDTSLLYDLSTVACGSAPDGRTSFAYLEPPYTGKAVVEEPHVGYLSDPKEPSPSIPCYTGAKERNVIQPSEEKSAERTMVLISNHDSEAFHREQPCWTSMNSCGPLSNFYGVNSHDQVISDSETEKNYLVEDSFLSSLGSAEKGYNALDASVQELNGVETQEANSAIHTNTQNPSLFPVTSPCLTEYGAVIKDINSSVSQFNEQLLDPPTLNQDLIMLEMNGTIPAASISAQDIPLSVQENLHDFMNVVAEADNTLNNSGIESSPDPLASETEMAATDDSSLLSTRSGHVVSIDFLEDFIVDAKTSKKTLASSVETVNNMMKEVELLELRAIQAKEEASSAGQGILIKVEELKQMLKHAKEMNNMHAGEVYGERAILATEARELQSRLLSLSNERNKSLSIIEEIRGTLEARVTAAEQEIAAAEQEKVEKEESAHKALLEEEVFMSNIVEVSKNLQQEAAENSKLREFLMDRGRIVDTLQGEISVICEDVLLLKERVAGRVPLGRSLRSTAAASLASSLSSTVSCRKSISLSDRAPDSEELTESPWGTEVPKAQQVEMGGDAGKESYPGGKNKALSDDDWEIFDAES